MKILQLHYGRTPFGQRRQCGELLSEQELTTTSSPPCVGAPIRHTPVSAKRVAQLRRDIAAGVYLRKNTEQKIAAVVDGLLREMVADNRQRRPSCRAAV
jgi:hypothetical protein